MGGCPFFSSQADLVDLICAIATHGEAAAESEALQRALARRDELAAEPSAEAPPAAAPAPVDPTVLSLTFDNLQLLDCAQHAALGAPAALARRKRAIHETRRLEQRLNSGKRGRSEGGLARRVSDSN